MNDNQATPKSADDEFNMAMLVEKCGRVSVNLAPLLMLVGMVTASDNNFHGEHVIELLEVRNDAL